MRSVFTFLPNCTKAEVECHLGFSLPGQSTEPKDAAIAYVDLYEDAAVEMPDTLYLIQLKQGTLPLCVAADISGRTYARQEATSFCIHLLERFGGYAMDDYSEHLWTMEELRNGGTFRGHGFFDTKGWNEEKTQSTHRGMVLCIPGPWRDGIDLLKAVISRPPEGEFIYADGTLTQSSTSDHVLIEFFGPDPDMRRAFQIAGQGRMSQETLDAIAQHASVVFMELPANAIEDPERLTKFTSVIKQAGGLAVKVETSGVAHEWERWLKLLSGSTFDRYCSAVTLIGGDDDYYYSCGMHHFGLPECSLHRSIDPSQGADIIHRFNMYQIVEKPALASGHTFSLAADSPVFRLTREDDTRHDKDDRFHNPHGVWYLDPTM